MLQLCMHMLRYWASLESTQEARVALGYTSSNSYLTRVKYVDNLSVLEIIPRCSTSMLPFVARDICSHASSHGMKLNPSKCKELLIDFLQYKPSDLPPLQMSDSIIEQVSSYKLLDVHLLHNLSWAIHCDYIVKRACKGLYVLRVLMKSGLPPDDLRSLSGLL